MNILTNIPAKNILIRGLLQKMIKIGKTKS